MSDLHSRNLFDLLDDDGQTSAVVAPKKDAKAGDKTTTKKTEPKKEKVVPKQSTEEPAAPLGKDLRGVVPSHKSRGRGRDNKGGLRRPTNPGQREFDRRSGPSASHRNPKEGKRHDHGKYNWGNEIEESTAAAKTGDAEQPVNNNNTLTPAGATEENKTEATTETKDPEQKEEPKEVDPEDEADKKLVTYEQYLKQKESKAPAHDKLMARAVENDERFEGTPIVSNKKKTKEEDKEEHDKKEKAAQKKKKNVSLDEFRGSPPTAPPPRLRAATEGSGERRGGGVGRGNGRGASRGTGRGRGGPSRGRGGGGGRGGRGGRAPDNLDEAAFPKLGK